MLKLTVGFHFWLTVELLLFFNCALHEDASKDSLGSVTPALTLDMCCYTHIKLNIDADYVILHQRQGVLCLVKAERQTLKAENVYCLYNKHVKKYVYNYVRSLPPVSA